MYEYPEQQMITALDGCSAPIFSVPVKNQAIAYKNLVSNNHLPHAVKAACKVVVNAVSNYPFMVAGSKRYCTDMMQITAPKIIGKTGAEGIFCMTFTEQKLGVCIKIDDGKMLPQYNVAQALINASGLFSTKDLEPLQHHLQSPIINFNKLTTGAIKVSDTLLKQIATLKIV
jgi:L-asparaginase II